jgi:hypothetical protein
MIDLNVFVPPGTGITLTDVNRINDNGEMFGSGTLANGEFRASHDAEAPVQKQLTSQKISEFATC